MDFKIVILVLCLSPTFGKSINNMTSKGDQIVTINMFEDLKKNLTDTFTQMISHGVSSQTERIFFYVRMPAKNVVYNINSIVKFSTVLYNEGNHFNSGDSVFVAPVSGLYLFSWTVQCHNAKSIHTELKVDNVTKEKLVSYLNSGAGYFSNSRVVISEVKKNDHVWIETSSSFSENYFQWYYNTGGSFMGVLLFKD